MATAVAQAGGAGLVIRYFTNCIVAWAFWEANAATIAKVIKRRRTWHLTRVPDYRGEKRITRSVYLSFDCSCSKDISRCSGSRLFQRRRRRAWRVVFPAWRPIRRWRGGRRGSSLSIVVVARTFRGVLGLGFFSGAGGAHGELFFQRGDQFVDGAADGGGQLLAGLEKAAGDGVERGLGCVPIEFLRPGQQRFGSCVVGEGGARRSGTQRNPVDLAGAAGNRSIDKDDARGARDRLHQFRQELLLAEDLDCRIVDPVPEEIGGDEACAIIAAERVAVAYDQRAQRVRHRSTSSPVCDRSSTSRARRPSACVEQLRHGSKVRMTASTRFNMPSVSLLPCTKWRATCNTPRFMAALLCPVAMIRLAQVMSPSRSTL